MSHLARGRFLANAVDALSERLVVLEEPRETFLIQYVVALVLIRDVVSEALEDWVVLLVGETGDEVHEVVGEVVAADAVAVLSGEVADVAVVEAQDAGGAHDVEVAGVAVTGVQADAEDGAGGAELVHPVEVRLQGGGVHGACGEGHRLGFGVLAEVLVGIV